MDPNVTILIHVQSGSHHAADAAAATILHPHGQYKHLISI